MVFDIINRSFDEKWIEVASCRDLFSLTRTSTIQLPAMSSELILFMTVRFLPLRYFFNVYNCIFKRHASLCWQQYKKASIHITFSHVTLEPKLSQSTQKHLPTIIYTKEPVSKITVLDVICVQQQ